MSMRRSDDISYSPLILAFDLLPRAFPVQSSLSLEHDGLVHGAKLASLVVYDTRHMSTPPTFLANASLDSRTPLDVARNIHSPKFSPGTTPPFSVAGKPLVNLANSETSTVIRREGLLIIVALLSTGFPSQYFKPSHSRRFATLAVVTGSGACEIICSAVGGWGPARYTEEKKPWRWSAMASWRLYLVDWIEVRPRRALEAFWRCEHMCAMLRMEGMVVVCGTADGQSPAMEVVFSRGGVVG